ncbi:uncharacterized protein A4U43_C02F2240 [Asparagus officinalis]|uniref:Uncharacterized protein n=1 Tax=Asparagus officinalis TaxID=4686 RepID=A0A5P1FF64_ASPOF|nr:uncharacterized protein A4U43_C02F2240 [Asparagus officinalis]
MSTNQAKKGTGNPLPKRGQVKARIFSEIFSALKGGKHDEKKNGGGAQASAETSASASPVEGSPPSKDGHPIPDRF